MLNEILKRTVIPDHLPAFGINCETVDELQRFCHRVIQQGTAIQVPEEEHRLVRWEASEGIHIWMYVNPANEVESMFPFYYPADAHELEIKRLLQENESPGENLLLEGWVVDRGDKNRGGDISHESVPSSGQEWNRGSRLSFVCVDAPLYVRELEQTTLESFPLVGVCRKPKRHLDRKAFEQTQRQWGGGIDMNVRSFIPSDVLNLDVDPFFQETSITPYAYVSGIVRSSTVQSPSDKNNSFIHVELDTNGMVLDILFGEGAVPTTPEQGNVLEGHFLLLGMMKERSSTS